MTLTKQEARRIAELCSEWSGKTDKHNAERDLAGLRKHVAAEFPDITNDDLAGVLEALATDCRQQGEDYLEEARYWSRLRLLSGGWLKTS